MTPRSVMAWTLLTASAAVALGCGGPRDEASARGAARVGTDPVPTVHLFENHSGALIAWKKAGVRNRVLVHIDGHSDLDWLPDGTVGRIAAADATGLRFLEHHPYAMDGETMRRFGIWNFVYPAARLGIIRTLVWVVPDGTIGDAEDGWRLAREILAGKLEHVGLAEAAGLQVRDGVVMGEILGVPILVCELADLPSIDEPVLLDLDLDYFTTSSALTQNVTQQPWIGPDELLDGLHEKGIRTDLATLSLSTIGGYLPPENRWLGRYLTDRLRLQDTGGAAMAEAHRDATASLAAGEPLRAAERFREALEASPDDPWGWFCLARSLAAAGLDAEAAEARLRAMTLDPLLGHSSLFEGDRHWLNGDSEEALASYRRYLEELPVGPFTAYALRREGSSLMRLRRDDEAIEVYERVVAMAPEHADSFLDLGVLYRERGEIALALEAFGRARSILPERSTYATALGNTLMLAGRPADAIPQLEAAVAAKPTAVRAQVSLAAALLEVGRPQEAAKYIRIALSLAPRDPRARGLARAWAARGERLTDP